MSGASAEAPCVLDCPSNDVCQHATCCGPNQQVRPITHFDHLTENFLNLGNYFYGIPVFYHGHTFLKLNWLVIIKWKIFINKKIKFDLKNVRIFSVVDICYTIFSYAFLIVYCLVEYYFVFLFLFVTSFPSISIAVLLFKHNKGTIIFFKEMRYEDVFYDRANV